jgi:ribA/ribD-fused uncharacterized protein
MPSKYLLRDWSEYRPKQFEYNGKWIKNWFSNMALIPVTIDDVNYPSVENYYQSMKTFDKFERSKIEQTTPAGAKRLGRKIRNIRPDWEDIKYYIMKQSLIHKFTQHEDQKQLLLATNDDVIIEWNNWGDQEWGVSTLTNTGRNMLGLALMEARELLKHL